MKFNDVINALKENNLLVSYDESNISFDYITYNSKDVKESTLFVCKGASFKKEYLEEAITSGVTCYISESDYEVDVPKVIVNDIRRSLALISGLFYSDNLYKIGITGTKGKTTTNYFIHNILKNHLGYKPGILATHYYYTGVEEGESHLTTPESLELHKYLNQMMNSDIGYMSMEVSSQAVLHERVYKMNFDIGCFLNIGPDHISDFEHKDFDDYFNCKLGFLKLCDKVLVYRHTDYFEEVIESVKDKEVITFGFKDADYIIENIVNDKGLSFDLSHNGESKSYKISMAGRFNIINATCAIIASEIIGISYEDICKGLIETEISGRMNILYGKCPIIVDYAHNKVSAEALYESIKGDYPGKTLKVVFGATGDKGPVRRYDLGDLAGKYADYVYLTSDDPGKVSVYDICDDIIECMGKYHHNYEIVVDRREAIRKAIHESTSDDVLAIIGKGDENFLIIGEEYIPYETDRVVVEEELSKIKEG